VTKKVLHVTQATGGVETSLLLILRHWDRSRFDIHLACPPDTTLARGARALGVRVFEITMVRNVHPLRDLAGLFSLVKLIRRERYDIVHGHSAKGGYLARIAARLGSRAKTIYHPRAFSYLTQSGLRRTFFLLLERLAVRYTDVLIATSESERRRAIEEVGYNPNAVQVIPNSIDPDSIGHSVSSDPKDNIPQPPLDFTVLTAGRLSYQKNPAMFVRAAAIVAKQLPNVRFLMVGAGFAGPLEDHIRDLVNSEGLANRLFLIPWTTREKTLEFIAAADVFALTSRFEGMPNTLLEAMMLGKAVVATDVDGTRDLVTSDTGFLVKCDDHEAMAGRIIQLLRSPGHRSTVGDNAREHVTSSFDIRLNVQKLISVYASV
jgi:glycosyltransferase involved in cell wall biosynthesis